MTDKPISLTTPPDCYTDWLQELKGRIHNVKQRVALAVNQKLILLYWRAGQDIQFVQQTVAQMLWEHNLLLSGETFFRVSSGFKKNGLPLK